MGKKRAAHDAAPGSKRSKVYDDGRLKYEQWIDSYRAVSRWLQQYDIEALLDANGGLVRLHNFLPERVADGILSCLQAIPEQAWNETSASRDYTANNIGHSFWSTKGAGATGLEPVLRLFSTLLPGELSTFSAARYDNNDHIEPHDDRAYTEVGETVPEGAAESAGLHVGARAALRHTKQAPPGPCTPPTSAPASCG